MIIDPIISKNVALIKDANGKDIERIYDKYGNLVFKNWNTLEGPFPIGCFTSSNKLRNYRIYGNTVQDGTPAPENPVDVVGCGVRTGNLLDYTTVENTQFATATRITNGISVSGKYFVQFETVNFIIGHSYSMTWTAKTISGTVSPMWRFRYTDGTYSSLSVSGGHLTVEKKLYKILLYVNASSTENGVAEFTNIMLRPDSPLPYEPYGYKIPVTVSGVNLFDYNWLWTKENVKNDYFNYITIAMKPNTEYTISNNYRVLKSPERIETALIVVNSETEITTVNGGVDRIRTVTTASDGLLRIAYRIRPGNVNYQDIVVNRDTLADGTYYIQINEGSSALPYEPYHEPITTPVYIGSEPLHKIGDYADYVDYKRGVVVRRIKKLVLTGEEDWHLWSSGQTAVERYFYKWGKTVPSNSRLICTHFPFSNADGNFEHARIGGTYRDDLIIFISKTIAQSSDDFKSYLTTQYSAGTPVTVWYVLAEPEEEVLPLSQKIPTNIGSNTFSCTISPAPSKAMIQYKKK